MSDMEGLQIEQLTLWPWTIIFLSKNNRRLHQMRKGTFSSKCRSKCYLSVPEVKGFSPDEKDESNVSVPANLIFVDLQTVT
ncbi:hypothetical protein Plhal304r1_c039g0117191 [Plasmopara halstedii]